MRKILLVTGGANGIGAATSILAASQGYDIAISYRSDHKAAESVAQKCRAYGVRTLLHSGDIAIPGAVTAMFSAIDTELGPISDVVNNAGAIGKASMLAEANEQTIRDIIDLNVTAAILVTKEAVKRMSIENGGSGGSIVNLSSVAAELGSPNEFVWYAASKGAINSLTLGLAQEVASVGIRVNAVAPGLIETRIHEASTGDDRLKRLVSDIPMQRAGKAEEVADAILYLLSDKASYITGSVLKVAGGR